jgi:UDP-N-acetyl-D-glucosamine dehydrogenase
MEELTQKIKNRKAKIIVIGLGYVGLPLAGELAKTGFNVVGLDQQKDKINKINKGTSYIKDIKTKTLREVVKRKKLKATANKKALGKADVIIICVPTPLNKNKQPDTSYIISATKDIKRYLHKNQLIVLESTTYPGTTREVILPILEKTGLKVGRDFYLAFSPERIDPGNKKYKVGNIPKIVGGITAKCAKLATLVYKSFVDKVVTVSSPETAEMTKLLENIFRIVNISMINELTLLCGKMGIDIWEVIEAAKTKPYGFMPFYPSPKIGGHCIPLDPFYLSWKAKEYNFYTRFIELAGEINEQMPHFIVTKIIYGLNENKKPVKGSKILVLGVAYKKDIGDTRASAAYDIIWDILRKKAKVDYYDPYVKTFRLIAKTLKSIKYRPSILKKYDCVLILTDHSGLDYDKIAKEAKLVVDTRNAIKNRKYKNVVWL